jgi:hypothetical protein
MEELQDRLSTLVHYWVEHNREHEEEMRQWAEKAASLGPEVAQALQMAAANMAKATASLEQAQEALRRGGGPSAST